MSTRPSTKKAPLAFSALEQRAAPPLRAGRTIATIDLGKQAVTFAAYGRRARARALGNSAEILHARAMGKVFEGGPQPALVTFEVSLKF